MSEDKLAQQRQDEIRARLAALTPSLLEIVDESHLHVGHAGAPKRLGALSCQNSV